MKVVRAVRTAQWQNKPGILKIELENVDTKVKVLREKKCLKDKAEFRNVFIKSAKSIELHFKTIHGEMEAWYK